MKAAHRPESARRGLLGSAHADPTNVIGFRAAPEPPLLFPSGLVRVEHPLDPQRDANICVR